VKDFNESSAEHAGVTASRGLDCYLDAHLYLDCYLDFYLDFRSRVIWCNS
jgi:hypothetical protein